MWECGLTAEHVHFVLLNGSGKRGSYVSLLGKVLCGYQVVELNNDLTDIILQGLTQTKDQVFAVPQCMPFWCLLAYVWLRSAAHPL